MDASSSSLKWWVLILSALSVVMTGIDATAVNLILAPMSVDLHVPISTTQWTLNAYLLIYAACIVAGGRLGDIFGQKKMIMIGYFGFMLGSLFAVFGQHFSWILLGRLLQGISVACLSPNAMAVIYLVFPENKKGMVTGVISSALAGGITLGPLIGGLLTHLYSWRLVFIINIPIGIIAMIIAAVCLSSSSFNKKGLKQLDLFGVITLGSFLFCLVETINLIHRLPTVLPWFIGLLIISIVLLVLFILIELKASNPLMEVELLKNKIISIGCIARFLYGLPITALVFIMALYLQHALGYSTLIAGLMFLPLTGVMMLFSTSIGKWVDKGGVVMPLIIGILLSIIAYLGMAFINQSIPVWWIIILFALIGLGAAFSRPPLVTAIMKASPQEHLSLITSIVNMMNAIGGSVGIAIAGMILGWFTDKYPNAALLHTMPVVMYICVGSSVLTMFLILVFLRKKSS